MSDESENRALRSRIATQENQIAHLEKTITQLRAELVAAQKSAWLGNATTGEMLDELKARAVINGYARYRTVDKDENKGDAPL